MKSIKFNFRCFSIIQRYHPNEYNDYVGSKARAQRKNMTYGKLPLNQNEFEQELANFVAKGMLPLSLVSLRAFKDYTHSNYKQFFRSSVTNFF